MSNVREAAKSHVLQMGDKEGGHAHLLQVPGSSVGDKSISEAEVSDCEFGDQSFDEDLTGMGKHEVIGLEKNMFPVNLL